MTVRENVAFGLNMLKRSKAEIDERVRVASQILQLDELLDRKPSQLSGGQRRRVAIGRAVVRHPRVFLFDEPLLNLDAQLRASMRVELAKLHHQIGATMIYVTHHQVEAMTMADKIVVLNAGRIEHVGTPLELYERPKNQFVAGFTGSPKMNFVTEELAKRFGAATIGIRPENMTLSTSEGIWKDTVTVVEHLEGDTYSHVNSDIAGNLIVRVPGNSPLSHGETVWVSPQNSKIHKFDAFGAVI